MDNIAKNHAWAVQFINNQNRLLFELLLCQIMEKYLPRLQIQDYQTLRNAIFDISQEIYNVAIEKGFIIEVKKV